MAPIETARVGSWHRTPHGKSKGTFKARQGPSGWLLRIAFGENAQAARGSHGTKGFPSKHHEEFAASSDPLQAKGCIHMDILGDQRGGGVKLQQQLPRVADGPDGTEPFSGGPPHLDRAVSGTGSDQIQVLLSAATREGLLAGGLFATSPMKRS